MPRLDTVDQATGLPVRQPATIRDEKSAPGELVHIDTKKLGRIPDGGGHHRPWLCLPVSCRGQSLSVSLSEILTDERKETAAFWQRAYAFFSMLEVTVQALMTANGACYRSRLFNDTLNPEITHRFSIPYRHQTNGKLERFNRTLAQEWATQTPIFSNKVGLGILFLGINIVASLLLLIPFVGWAVYFLVLLPVWITSMAMALTTAKKWNRQHGIIS